MLLVLDNFEQVIEAGASVNRLLTACPNLTVLTSSRSALQVSGEQEHPVPPLGLPDPANLPPLGQLSQYEAVALFIERARAVKPNFEVTNENAPAVAEICVRLDGLPLAIELAAARIRVLTPQAMLGRLGDRLGLLSSGSRDLPARQQTLRSAIAWSHDMLDEGERELFARLSVFVGSAGLEFIERVCLGEGGPDPLDTLTSLVEKSLVREADGVGGEPRFGMLETIREFAIEQAIQRGQWNALGERHARAYADFARESAGNVMGSQSGEWLDRFAQDHDNVRAALTWAMANDTEAALRLVHDLWRFWQRRGHLVEGIERAEAALALPDATQHPAARAEALSAAAGLAYWLSDPERSRGHYEAEIEARQALGDRSGLADASYGISFTWSILELSKPDTAAKAAAMINQALEIYRELGDEAGIARCEWALANVYWGTGLLAEAKQHAAHSLELFKGIDDRFMVGWAQYTLGCAELAESIAGGGDPAPREEARRRFVDSLRIFMEADDLSGYALVLDALAALMFHAGDRERAARLTGAVSVLERTSGTALNLWNRDALQFDPDALRADPSLAGAIAEGEAMSTAEAVAYALGERVETEVAAS
jgi:predicted ATPase